METQNDFQIQALIDLEAFMEVKKLLNLWVYLTEKGIATTEEISLVTSINGCNLDSVEDILYYRTGYRTLEQIQEMEGDY